LSVVKLSIEIVILSFVGFEETEIDFGLLISDFGLSAIIVDFVSTPSADLGCSISLQSYNIQKSN